MNKQSDWLARQPPPETSEVKVQKTPEQIKTRRRSQQSNDSGRDEPEHFEWLFLIKQVFSSFCNLIKHTNAKTKCIYQAEADGTSVESYSDSGMNETLEINWKY